jgi:RHS repeat-associated protein
VSTSYDQLPVLGPSSRNNCTMVTDQVGNQRRSCSDPEGRLIEVDEPGNNFPGTPGTGSVTISGTEQSKPGCGGTCYDHGQVTITVNGTQNNYVYGPNDTSSTIATALAAMMNGSLFSATVNGTTITMTALSGGTITNYSLSTTVSWDNGDFAVASFSASKSGSTFTGGTNGYTTTGPPSISTPLETMYSYDVLNNLLSVNQEGGAPTDSTQWRTRTFAYNSLSQLLCSANPEIALVTCPNPDNGSYTAGTVRYSYDNDGNLLTKTSPKPNQTSPSTTVVTTYTYNDLDNRLTQKSYNDGTPTVKFAYDTGSLSGCITSPPSQTDSYPKGRRTSMCDFSGGTSWAHDQMGRILSERRTIGTVHGDYDTDIYNLDGSVGSITSLGYQVGYTYNGAGRPITVKNFADPFNYVTSATYAPFGALATSSMGAKPINISNQYTKRLQPGVLSADTSVATIISLTYDFHLGTGDNGNVYQIVNGRDSNRTQNFIYDALNRIQQAYSSGPNWGETYGSPTSAPGTPPTTPGIDAWGNLFIRSGVTGKTMTEGLSVSATKQNQLTGFSYDAAGNMILNGASYTYDAENHLISTSGMSYLYDGDGNRVEKCTAGSTAGTCATSPTGTLYWRGTGSDPLTETDLSGNALENYIFFNGKRIARRDSSTKVVHFYFSDELGTHDLITDANGDMPPQEESDYYPYGGEIVVSGSDPVNHYKFTGKERDSESGLDNFGARFDASSLGRFMSPDWSAGEAPVPYADPDEPQSLNLYAYAQNNPTSLVDTDGHKLIVAPELQAAVDTLSSQSASFEEELDAHKGPNNPDLTITEGDVNPAPNGESRDGGTHANISGGDTVDTCSSATDCTTSERPAVYHGATVTIDNSEKGDNDKIEGTLKHEIGHVNDARTNTKQYKKDRDAPYPEGVETKNRPEEVRANIFKAKVNSQIKEHKKEQKKEKKESHQKGCDGPPNSNGPGSNENCHKN